MYISCHTLVHPRPVKMLADRVQCTRCTLMPTRAAVVVCLDELHPAVLTRHTASQVFTTHVGHVDIVQVAVTHSNTPGAMFCLRVAGLWQALKHAQNRP